MAKSDRSSAHVATAAKTTRLVSQDAAILSDV